MKVQTLVIAASAALILSAQGVAQSDTGLERALTELNAGLTAPAGSASMAISGDARIRNNMTVGKDKKALDARARLNFDFNVNEGVSVSLGATANSDWDGDGTSDNVTGDNNINRYTVSAANLLGDGGTFTAGTQYFTLGSGRILGSDDWDPNPTTSTGIWYDNAGFSLFFLEDMTTLDADTYGLTFDYSFALPGAGDISMRPYLLGDVGGDDGSFKLSTGCYGSELSGSFGGFNWNGEYANQDGATAWTASTSIEISALASVPGITGASLDLSTSTADDAFDADGGLHWGQIGDVTDGALFNSTNTSSAGMSFSPMEGWNGRLSRVDNDGVDSWNFTAATTLAGAVDMWVGYANGDAADDSFWMSMSLNF